MIHRERRASPAEIRAPNRQLDRWTWVLLARRRRMIPRYDLLVVGRDDNRVQLVAETDLSFEVAEERIALYEPLKQQGPVVISMAKAGTYFAGEHFIETWHEEEE
jgi:hypothetical protein